MSAVETARVGDILQLERHGVEIEPDESYRRIGIYSWGKGFLHRPAVPGTEMGSLRYFTFPKPSLVMSNIQAWEAALAVAGEKEEGMVASNRFLPYVPIRDNSVDLDYLKHYFLSDPGLAQLRRASPGTQVRNRTLGKKLFEDLVVPLPPLSDQRRIAAHLDSVAEWSESLVDGGGVALASIEASWLGQAYAAVDSWMTMGEAGPIARGSIPKLSADGAPFVGQAAVRWGSLDLTRAKLADGEWLDSVREEKRTRVGDLLLNSTGEGTIGRAAVVDPSTEGLVTDSKVLTIRPGDMVDSTYLALYLRGPHGQAAIESAKGANTTKQTELGVERCQRLPVPRVDRVERERVVDGWTRFAVGMEKAQVLSERRSRAVQALLPAARNEVFSALR